MSLILNARQWHDIIDKIDEQGDQPFSIPFEGLTEPNIKLLTSIGYVVEPDQQKPGWYTIHWDGE